MVINMNSNSRELITAVELNPRIGDFFKTIELMRTKKLKSVKDYVALTRGAKVAVSVMKNNLFRADAIKVAEGVMGCYMSHLETGRVFPYDMYLSNVKPYSASDTTLTLNKESEANAALITSMSMFRFDSVDEIIESSSAIYVIMAAIFGWETLTEGVKKSHIM